MAITSEARALPFFTDLLGSPLESGSIYIGQPGLDPIAYPVIVTADIAGTVTVAQPVRTTHGHAVQGGSLIHLFCPIPYSITILDGAGRLVYASLNETDPVAVAQSTSTIQISDSLAALRARDKSSTNIVWVNGSGMFVYDPTDTTSPERLPSIVVGNDGARYHLSTQYVSAGWVNVANVGSPGTPGGWFSWNDGGDFATYITNNIGAGTGGIILRTVSADGLTELGRITISNSGTITMTGTIASGQIASSSDIGAAGNLTALGGTLGFTPGASRALKYDTPSNQYQLPNADLLLNGSRAVTQNTFSSNGVGAVALGNSTSPQPVLPGTWVATGSAFNTVVLWVRTA